MRNRFRLAIGLALALAGAIWLRERFRRWQREQIRRTRHNTRLIPISSRGHTLEYTHMGDGSPILLIHGSPGGSDSWIMYHDLIDQGFSIVCPARPGYLRTPLRGARTFQAQADLFIGLLDILKISDTVVVGFSAGGPIAIHMALHNPERVRALVLQSAITHPFELRDILEETIVGHSWIPTQMQKAFFWVGHRLLRRYPQQMVPGFFAISMFGNLFASQQCAEQILDSPEQLETFLAMFEGNLPLGQRQRGYDNDITQLSRMTDLPLHEIRVPTLIIHSTLDTSVSFQHARHAAEKIPSARLLQVEGCGHFVLLGQNGPSVLNELTDFLNNTAQH